MHSDRSLIKNKLSVAKRLLKRIRLAPVGIPNSHLALLHTSSPDITRCSFTIFDLDNEITLAAMDHNEIQVKRILLMLGPEDLSEVEQGVVLITLQTLNLTLKENCSQLILVTQLLPTLARTWVTQQLVMQLKIHLF